MRRPLNLASRPFRNETLPALGFGLACVVLLALTVQHVLALRRILPGRDSELHKEVAVLEQEQVRLRAEARDLRGPRPAPTVLAHWALVKDLVDRRTFWWSDLLVRLEETLPPRTRLVSIAPMVKEGQVRLEITAVVRSTDAGLELGRVLEKRIEFRDVRPASISSTKEGDEEFRYTMRYAPPAPGTPAASPAKGAQDSSTQEPDDPTSIPDPGADTEPEASTQDVPP